LRLSKYLRRSFPLRRCPFLLFILSPRHSSLLLADRFRYSEGIGKMRTFFNRFESNMVYYSFIN
jgi:hypothetical protein